MKRTVKRTVKCENVRLLADELEEGSLRVTNWKFGHLKFDYRSHF